jgi:hypothetical protein
MTYTGFRFTLFVFAVVFSITANAQQAQKSVDRLKSEHNRLTTIANDSGLSPELRDLNRSMLSDNEKQLKEALKNAIAEIGEYRSKNQDIFSADQLKRIDEKVDALRYDFEQLNRSKAQTNAENLAQTTAGSSTIEQLPASFVKVQSEPQMGTGHTVTSSPSTENISIKKENGNPLRVELNEIPIVVTVAGGVKEIRYTVTVGTVEKHAKNVTVPATGVVELTIPLIAGDNVVKVYDPRNTQDFDELTINSAVRVAAENKNGVNIQAYFGNEVSGASSSATNSSPFFNLKLHKHIRNLGNRPFAFWTDFRLATTPTQTLPNFAGLTGDSIAGFATSNQSASINELVQSLQMKIGLELDMGFNFSFIAGAGATTPLTARKSVQVYKIPRIGSEDGELGEVLPAFKELFGDIDYTGVNNLVLTSGDRDRFMRNWFVGGRLRLPMIDGANPTELDLTIGQDEAMTDKLIGAVLKFDGTIPIKIGKVDFLYIGTGFNLRMTRRVNFTTVPFFLEPVANFNLFDNEANLVRNYRDTPFGTSNRDSFSLRLGVDLGKLFKGADKKDQ